MITLIAEKIAEILGVVFGHILVEHVVTDRKALKSALSHSIVFRSRRLRISMAQILLFEIDNKFLLIQSEKRPQITPIGGVVRYFPSEKHLEGEFGFKPELMKGGERYDLRGYVVGKNFVRFLRWYSSGAGREQSTLAREIEEEFINIGIPDISKNVRRLEFVRKRIVHEGPTEIKDEGYWQYRFFEVFVLQEESDVSKQLADFIRSQVGKNSKLVLVSMAEIMKGQSADGRHPIGNSSGYLFSDSAHGIYPPAFV